MTTPTAPPGPLAALQLELARQVAEIIDTALDVEPAGGLSAAWRDVLGRHGATPLGEDERFAAAREAKLYRGAPIAEVDACLRAVASWMGAQLTTLGGQVDATSRARLDALLGTLADRGLEEYRRIACQRPRSMFASAIATAKQHQYAAQQRSSAYVLTCPTCGGPRLREGDLSCEYCGGQVGR